MPKFDFGLGFVFWHGLDVGIEYDFRLWIDFGLGVDFGLGTGYGFVDFVFVLLQRQQNLWNDEERSTWDNPVMVLNVLKHSWHWKRQ